MEVKNISIISQNGDEILKIAEGEITMTNSISVIEVELCDKCKDSVLNDVEVAINSLHKMDKNSKKEFLSQIGIKPKSKIKKLLNDFLYS